MPRFNPWNFALLVVANMLLCGLAFAGDDIHRATVPDGYVATPFGYFHHSCVRSLAKGEKLLPDGRVQHADATRRRVRCALRLPALHVWRTALNFSHYQA